MMAGRLPAGCFRLSRQQEAIWLISQTGGPPALYNIAARIRLSGAVDLERLRGSFLALVSRHQILRARFEERNGDPVMLCSPEAKAGWEFVDLSGPGSIGKSRLEERQREDARRPFNLRSSPLSRLFVYKLGEGRFDVLLCIHHIISDGYSIRLLIDEWAKRYEEMEVAVRPPASAAPAYPDHVEWQRSDERGPRHRQAVDFWRARLDGAPPFIDLCTNDRPAGGDPFAAAYQRFDLETDLVTSLRHVARVAHTSLFATILAALFVLLARMTATKDIIVGLPANGRLRPETKGMQGLFVNLLPVRAELEWSMSVTEFARQVKGRLKEAYGFQQVAFEDIVGAVAPPRAQGRAPLTQVTLNYFPFDRTCFQVCGLNGTREELDLGYAPFELTLKVSNGDAGLSCRFEYSTAKYDAQTVGALSVRLKQILRSMAEDPHQRLGSLPHLLSEERPPPARRPTPRSDRGRPLDLIASLARQQPDAPAIESADFETPISRGELQRSSNRLAHQLLSLGARRDVPVGIALPRGGAMIVAQLAVMKAGAAFMPLDPKHPMARRRQILATANSPILIADPSTHEVETMADWRTILLSARGETEGTWPTIEPGLSLGPDHLAYVIFTSGSTGEPKGVMIEHGSLNNLIDWYHRAYAVTHRDRNSVLAGPAFDSSIYEIWPALCAGSTLVTAPEHLALEPAQARDWLIGKRITIGFAPTPLAEQLIQMEWPADAPLRFLQVGGDHLQCRPRRGLPFKVVNSYGPAEGTVVSTEGVVEPEPAQGSPDIGFPIDGTEVFLLAEDGALVPYGVPGDLHIAGANLARGYLGRPDLTADRFVTRPDLHGRRLYRTGDIARRGKSGRLLYLGRLDRQVKIRGQRVELGEIEAALKRMETVCDAVVLYRREGPEEPVLTAFLVLEGGASLDPTRIRRALKRSLPAYMVPTTIVELQRLPLTPNGKIDRAALMKIEVAEPARNGRSSGIASAGVGSSPSRIELARLLEFASAPAEAAPPPEDGSVASYERMLLRIWQDFFGSGQVGVRDDFFELGGHSLLAVRLVARIRSETQRELSLRAFFRAPTVFALARHLAELDVLPRDAAKTESG